jgi:uncharacterized protein YndB with AHSA1/START domain
MEAMEWHGLRPVEMDFLESAPSRYVIEHEVRLPRSKVWALFVDPTTWPGWWPGVEEATYRGDPPFGVGTIRAATVSGQRYEETLLAWEEGKRWAYRIDRSTLPLAKAQLEVSEFEDAPSGTRVRWILVADDPLAERIGAPFQEILESLLAEAMTNLEAYASKHETMGGG